jgi:DNA-directed RNA polymerase subunit M/transcription elongation factor TFIIS
MVKPKCPKCDGEKFEADTKHISGASGSVLFVHCTACGCVVGVLWKSPR